MDSTNSSQDRDARDQMAGFAGRPHYDSVRQPMELFAVWTPWTPIQAAPPGTGWRIHPQADLVVTCHLHLFNLVNAAYWIDDLRRDGHGDPVGFSMEIVKFLNSRKTAKDPAALDSDPLYDQTPAILRRIVQASKV